MSRIGIGIGLGTGQKTRAWRLPYEEDYAQPLFKGLVGFKTNFSKTFSAGEPSAMAKLSVIDARVSESLSMTLTVAGVTVKTM